MDIVESPVHAHDLNVAILHLRGLDHKRLTYRYQGREFRLTNVHGEIVRRFSHEKCVCFRADFLQKNQQGGYAVFAWAAKNSRTLATSCGSVILSHFSLPTTFASSSLLFICF